MAALQDILHDHNTAQDWKAHRWLAVSTKIAALGRPHMPNTVQLQAHFKNQHTWYDDRLATWRPPPRPQPPQPPPAQAPQLQAAPAVPPRPEAPPAADAQQPSSSSPIPRRRVQPRTWTTSHTDTQVQASTPGPSTPAVSPPLDTTTAVGTATRRVKPRIWSHEAAPPVQPTITGSGPATTNVPDQSPPVAQPAANQPAAGTSLADVQPVRYATPAP
jgi:hypothetical protein